MTSFQDAPDEIVRMSNNLRFVLESKERLIVCKINNIALQA